MQMKIKKQARPAVRKMCQAKCAYKRTPRSGYSAASACLFCSVRISKQPAHHANSIIHIHRSQQFSQGSRIERAIRIKKQQVLCRSNLRPSITSRSEPNICCIIDYLYRRQSQQSIQTAIRRCIINHDNFIFQRTVNYRIDTTTQQLTRIIIDDNC